MSKQKQYFQKITDYKERFREMTTEELRQRLQSHGISLYKEAAIALRELLEEREANE